MARNTNPNPWYEDVEETLLEFDAGAIGEALKEVAECDCDDEGEKIRLSFNCDADFESDDVDTLLADALAYHERIVELLHAAKVAVKNNRKNYGRDEAMISWSKGLGL